MWLAVLKEGCKALVYRYIYICFFFHNDLHALKEGVT
jgi:hypothetical protein